MAIVTQHAKRRYSQRIRVGSDEREAFHVLKNAVERAVDQGRRSSSGARLLWWDNPEMWLVTKHDHNYGQILVTVLSPEMDNADAKRQGKQSDLSRLSTA